MFFFSEKKTDTAEVLKSDSTMFFFQMP